MVMSRRDFLAAIPAGAALSAALPLGAAAAAGPRLGCQTNAWAFMPRDFGMFLEVLGAQKSLGFEGFETSFRNVQGQLADAPAIRTTGWDGWVLAEEERADGSKPGATAAAPARETLRKLFGR